jgi:hypothetical protein
MPSNTPRLSAAEQAAAPRNRGERRAQAAQSRKPARAPPLFNIDPGDPTTWPALMRLSEICRDRRRNYPGVLPITRSTFLDAVADGYIPPGIKLGAKALAWRREIIVHIAEHGVVGRREQGRRAKALAAQRRAAAEPVVPVNPQDSLSPA